MCLTMPTIPFLHYYLLTIRWHSHSFPRLLWFLLVIIWTRKIIFIIVFFSEIWNCQECKSPDSGEFYLRVWEWEVNTCTYSFKRRISNFEWGDVRNLRYIFYLKELFSKVSPNINILEDVEMLVRGKYSQVDL